MAEAKAKEEGESASSNEHTPPPPSPLSSTFQNPRKRNSSKYLLPSLYNCHSCDRHFPPRPQTLTSLQPLDSEWRIVLLCDQCLRLIRSAAKCSYCFSDFSSGGGRLLDCRQCSCRIHVDCVPAQQRFISPSVLNPESFVCVDCCALPRFGNKNPKSLFTRVSMEELVKEAKKKSVVASHAKVKALEKVRAAKCAAERAREALGSVSIVENLEIDPAMKDQELALQLHLAMNGSQRILRSGRTMDSDRAMETKKAKPSNGCSKCFEKVEFCTEDKGFLDSWNPSVELGMFESKEANKEIDGCSSSSPEEMVVKEEQESCSDKVVNSCEDNRTLAVWITYQRAGKSKGIGSGEKSSDTKQRLNGVGAGENFSESEQMSRLDSPDRYAKKYIKKKSILKKVLNAENGVVPCWQNGCLKACAFSDVPFSSFSGFRS